MQVPKYQVIAERIRALCAELHEGEQLPVEHELAASLGVSAMTVRRALDLLHAEGIITKVPGRGTFVRRGIVAKGSSFTTFAEDMQLRGMVPGTRVLGVDVVLPLPEIARDLSLGRSEHTLQLERLRLADEEPISLELTHIPQRYAKSLSESAFVSLHHRRSSSNASYTSTHL